MMINLKRLGKKHLDKNSSATSFSTIVKKDPTVRQTLGELDDCLEQIGLRKLIQTRSRSQTARTVVTDVFSECENDLRDDESSKQASLASKTCVERVHRHDFKTISYLGKGAFSGVQKVKNHSGETFALKALDSSRIKTPDELTTAAIDLGMEAKILSELNHKNIIKLRGVCSSTFSYSYSECTDEGYFLVLDLLEDVLSQKLIRWKKHSRLRLALENRRAILPTANVKMMYKRMQSVALGIVEGMVYLHKKGIVIRDLKPANIGFDRNGNVRLFDFGMARRLEDCDKGEICGSLRYMAPEVANSEGYFFKTDVYSFGIILCELCSLTVPYDQMMKKPCGSKEFSRRVAKDGMRPSLDQIACDATKELIKDCWKPSPSQRPSFEEIHERIVRITSCDRSETRGDLTRNYRKKFCSRLERQGDRNV
ncbi:unnamed protein product [Pseudo-nitzschia multistriata]|uniref:Protein kinase domain-containing protein n=1 Tax=Pseudo-nitzschia multistriata TaxID=183589 RepID=A0A448Z8A1_9STRA|nr:unnamed protein product [Pseudo-nitzschia multistriata]